ncbi:thermonuclease family protein [Cognatishimia sp. MH4019]|uniref:thermonuclease family protein n=1 Tax=Cognatishimia sp. MH4019 TaxID=2854030 RepID=UPI001CD4EACC|nr:thermonuclease family protein [Cognatishimia sp. MH4019]
MEEIEGLIAVLAIAGIVLWLLKTAKSPKRKQSLGKNTHPETKVVAPLVKPATPPDQKQFKKPYDVKLTKPEPSIETVCGRAFVVDGDTIVINKLQIRLFGIDAPELNHPYGQKAKWALVRLCKGHMLKADIIEEDTHGRTVARCWLPDGRDLSAEMVKEGLAIDWPKFSGGRYKILEVVDARKRMWLADARQKGRMHVWEQFEARQSKRSAPRT